MKIANLLKIADGIEQRSKRAAIKRLEVAGLIIDDAEKVLQLVQQRVSNLKGELCKFYDGVVRWIIEEYIIFGIQKLICKFAATSRDH